MSASRVKHTKKNIIWSYIDYIIGMLFSFVSRYLIVHVLGRDYLGLSSLFSSILTVLSMADLGFSTAIIYNLYKPIAEGDHETVCALLSFYKKIYYVVGTIIILCGIMLIPFLPKLINGSYPSEINIYFLYLLYLTNTGISYYLFAYKSALLNALQRMDLTKIACSIIHIFQCIFQIVIILMFQNYYLFFLVTIVATASKNILTAYFAKKNYPQYICRGNISQQVKKSIWKRVKGLLISKISSVTYTTFDNIILSSMIGLTAVTIYGNYLNVYNAVANLIILIRLAMQASIGNSIASESIEKNYNDLLIWQFLYSVIATWCSTCLLCLYQPFMTLWMGKEMLLPMIDVVFFSLLFITSTIQHSFYLYISGDGLWWEMRWPYILSAIANIIMNVLFCKLWETTGIILATFIANFVFGLIWQSSIVMKNYFKRSNTSFLLRQGLYSLVGVAIAVITFFVCESIAANGILGIIIKSIICMIIPMILFFFTYHKTIVFKQGMQIIKRVIINR